MIYDHHDNIPTLTKRVGVDIESWKIAAAQGALSSRLINKRIDSMQQIINRSKLSRATIDALQGPRAEHGKTAMRFIVGYLFVVLLIVGVAGLGQ